MWSAQLSGTEEQYIIDEEQGNNTQVLVCGY